MPMCHFAGKNIWILKPTGLNRGKGIHVVNSIKETKRLIRSTCQENKQQTKIIQKLTGNLKQSAFIFDARQSALPVEIK
jgi:phosphoribosylamine-glycine ligase